MYLIDTLRADHLKPFNASTRVRTPGLDQLVEARERVFTSARTQGDWTREPSWPPCSPRCCRGSITRSPAKPSCPAVRLLPELLQAHGFHTGAFIANGYVSDKFGFKQGWSSYRNYIREGRYNRARVRGRRRARVARQAAQGAAFLPVRARDRSARVRTSPPASSCRSTTRRPTPAPSTSRGRRHAAREDQDRLDQAEARDKEHLEALYDAEISITTCTSRAMISGAREASARRRHDGRHRRRSRRGVLGPRLGRATATASTTSCCTSLLIRVPGRDDRSTAATTKTSAGLVDVMPTVLDAIGESIPAELGGRSLLPELTAKPESSRGGRVGVHGRLAHGGGRRSQADPAHRRRSWSTTWQADPHEQTDVVAPRPIATRYLRGQLGLALAETEPGSEQAARRRKPHQEADDHQSTLRRRRSCAP